MSNSLLIKRYLQVPLQYYFFKINDFRDSENSEYKNIRLLRDKVLLEVFDLTTDNAEYFFKIQTEASSFFCESILSHIECQLRQTGDPQWARDHNTSLQCWLHKLSTSKHPEICDRAMGLQKTLLEKDFLAAPYSK